MNEDDPLAPLVPLINAMDAALDAGIQYALILLPDPNIPAVVTKVGRAEVQ